MKLLPHLAKTTFAALAALAFAALPADAKTIYVSQSTGDDNAAGTAATTPWKTLAKASSVEYQPGDSILLKKGDTWNEELTPKGSGTPEKPILISSYGEGKKPLIDREDFKQDRTGIRLDDKGGYKIVGLEFARCMTGIYAEYAKLPPEIAEVFKNFDANKSGVFETDEIKALNAALEAGDAKVSKYDINGDKTLDGKEIALVAYPTRKYLWIEDCYFHDSLLYGHYEDYPKRKIGLGVCLFSWELGKHIVLKDIMVKNCVFRRLASGFWTNSPDNFNKNASFVYNFANLHFDNCLFEEGYQWQLGIRGVDGGSVKNCVTHDIGRGFRSFNGVAGAMFFRCKDWIFEDSEWGYVDIGLGSGDGEAFDFEGNCDNMTMRNCNFHDTDGPGFLLCCYASDGNPNKGIVMENCVINAKSKRPLQPKVRAAIINTTDWTEATWKNCRFYLSKGEGIMAVMDPEKDKRSAFLNCYVKDLSAAASSTKHPAKETAVPASATEGQSFVLDFGRPVAINEFKLKEDAASGISRYIIEYWDDKKAGWMSCFNGMGIGGEFIAAIVPRTTSKARLRVIANSKDKAVLTAFEAYNDPLGDPLNVAKGTATPNRTGK